MPLFSLLLRTTVWITLSVVALSASAQSYYKCKTSQGRTQYSDQPSKNSDCKPIAIRAFGMPNVKMPVTTGVLSKNGGNTNNPTASPTATSPSTPNTPPANNPPKNSPSDAVPSGQPAPLSTAAL